MLTAISIFSPCTQWVFGPLSPVTPDLLPGLTYVDDNVTPSGKIVEKDSKVVDSGKRYPVPDPVDPIDPITSHAAQSSNPSKTVSQILSEIMLTLMKLKYELAIAFDEETYDLIGKLEREMTQLIANSNAQEDRKEEAVRKESQGKGVDQDGDVEIEGIEKATREEEIPNYRTYLLSQGGVWPTTSYLADIYTKIRALQGDVTSLKWKKVDDDNTLEGRVDLLEGKITALDLFREEDDTLLTTRRRSHRDLPERPVTRGMTQKLETRVDDYSCDLQNLHRRVRDLEREHDSSHVSRR